MSETVLGAKHRVNKIDKNPYFPKHPYSYLTRTYILVRNRNSENINKRRRKLCIHKVN